jgi:hypothetical protein
LEAQRSAAGTGQAILNNHHPLPVPRKTSPRRHSAVYLSLILRRKHPILARLVGFSIVLPYLLNPLKWITGEIRLTPKKKEGQPA